jgi:hypothetical protein
MNSCVLRRGRKRAKKKGGRMLLEEQMSQLPSELHTVICNSIT